MRKKLVVLAAVIFSLVTTGAWADDECVSDAQLLPLDAKIVPLWQDGDDLFSYSLIEFCCQSGTYVDLAIQVIKTSPNGNRSIIQDLFCGIGSFPTITVKDRAIEIELPKPDRFGEYDQTDYLTGIWNTKTQHFDVTTRHQDHYAEHKKMFELGLKQKDKIKIRDGASYLVVFHMDAYEPRLKEACEVYTQAVKKLLPDALRLIKLGQKSDAKVLLEPLLAALKDPMQDSTLARVCFLSEREAGRKKTSRYVTLFNNLAYGLIEVEDYRPAIKILHEVISFFPRRTVAYLNLSDAWAKYGENEQGASANAVAYADWMLARNEAAKIPPRILERASMSNLGCPASQRKLNIYEGFLRFLCPDPSDPTNKNLKTTYQYNFDSKRI